MKHHSCTVVRTMLIKHSTLSLRTGAVTEGASEWVTRPCGVPLFSDTEQVSGQCRSCADGWTAPTNYPAARIILKRPRHDY